MNTKRIISLVASLALVLSLSVGLTGCGDKAAQDDNQGSTDGEGTKYTVGICQLVQHEALDAATQGFIDALNEALPGQVEFQNKNASGDNANCSTIVNSFVSDGVDLIMANATGALTAAAAAPSALPILGTSITDYGVALGVDNWTGVSGTNISGTSDLDPLDGQAAMIQELFPDAKTIGLLYCSGEPNSIFQADSMEALLTDMGYSVERYTFADSNDVSSVTANACSNADVLYIPTDNTAASCTEAINNVALSAGIPIVAGEEGLASGCGVATLSISYYDLGRATGEMAAEILTEGADISTMEVRFAPAFTKEYNADICEALNITVPEDYVAIAK